jgi:hypothetical protein
MVSTMSYAQTYINEDKKIIDKNSSKSANEQLNIIQSENIFSSKTSKPSLGNSIFIDQVGSNNTGSVAVASDQSEINLLQIGSFNEAYITLNVSIIKENVAQLGNNNYFKDYSVHGAKRHTADVLQDGSYNEIISIGQNSVSERFKITQTGIGKQAYIIHN